MGNGCIIEHGVSFKFDNPWVPGPNIKLGDRVFVGSMCEFNITESISIGNDTNIASGCRFIDHNHGIALGTLIGLQPNPKAGISIGEGVWLGCNVVVLMGVTIEEGAVVAAGAVVTKSIPPNEIWGGIPAKKIGERK
ncbi:MAG: acyltransferase [Chitinophagaceae bacterium]